MTGYATTHGNVDRIVILGLLALGMALAGAPIADPSGALLPPDLPFQAMGHGNRTCLPPPIDDLACGPSGPISTR